MIDHDAVMDYRRTHPRATWEQTAAAMKHGGSWRTLKSAHNQWLRGRAMHRAQIPASLRPWTVGPERDYALAYTHGALWVDVGTRDRVAVCAGLDLHVGSEHHNPAAVESLCEWVRERDALLVIAGDVTENSHLSRHGSAGQVLTYDYAVEQAVSELKPVVDRIILITIGNHDARTAEKIGADPARAVARELGVPYCPGPCLVNIIIDGHMEPGYVAHGRGGGRSTGYLRTYAFRPFAQNDVSWAVQGHLHRPYADAEVVHVVDPASGKRVWHRRVGLVAGGAHKYGGYVERNELPPALLGTSYVVITPAGIPGQEDGGYGVVSLEGADV